MNEWAGALLLLGAAAGYGLFMAFQPYRWALAESWRAMRGLPLLWLVAGVFESARLTSGTVAAIARGGVTPEGFLIADLPGPFPRLAGMLLPAIEAAAGAMLTLATAAAGAWPISALLALALLVNAGGGLRGLWARGGGKGRFARRAFAILAAALAAAHLGTAVWVWRAGEAALEGGAGAFALAAAGRLFEAGCAAAVQVWIILRLVESRRGNRRGVPLAAVLARTGTLFVLILLWWAAAEGWRAAGPAEGWLAATAVPVAAAAGLWLLPAVIRAIGGEAGLARSMARHAWWIPAHCERVFWWFTAALMHLFLLSICGLGMEAALAEMSWIGWAWGMFFAFLKAGVIVWLLGAFVFLVEESQDSIVAPRASRVKSRR